MPTNEMSETRDKVSLLTKALDILADRPLRVMEVCGTHTVSIFRQGLRSLFPPNLELVSGPGCPVCVTDQGEIDAAISLASLDGVITATYGDMLRVPGSGGSLLDARSRGKDVRIITSAAQALDIARMTPEKLVVLVAVGFETTAPATASVVLDAQKNDIRNFAVLNLHKAVPPVLEALASDSRIRLEALLLPGHVSVVIGLHPYQFLPAKYGIACSVAGFGAEDIMLGLVEIARQVREDRPRVAQMYGQAARNYGNPVAQKLLEKVFCLRDTSWRGLGEIPLSGYAFREDFSSLDALNRLGLKISRTPPPQGCSCGEVLMGLIGPNECPLFGRTCTPSHPVGPCMVSGEGSCSAHYRFFTGGDDPWKRSA
ncbi:MAG TPA: hydrogenase formation protein HypD [Thermovirgaceae bacterium]|nr:hydrogenase formation protein HypD [Thermovirgaceae bacterium]